MSFITNMAPVGTTAQDNRYSCLGLFYLFIYFWNNQPHFGVLQQETLCAPHHTYHCWIVWRNINNFPVRNARNVNEFQRFLPQHSWLWTLAHGLIAANTVQASLADEVKPNLNWIQDLGEMNGTSPCCLLSHRFQRLDEIMPYGASIYCCALQFYLRMIVSKSFIRFVYS